MIASHIAVILHDFSTGGSERIAIRLANAWASEGRQVTLLCGTLDGALHDLVSAHVTIIVSNPETKRSLLSRVFLAFRLAKKLHQLSPDVVFAPGNYHILVIALLSFMNFSKQPVFICKLSNPVRRDDQPSWFTLIGEHLMRFATRWITAFTAMSPALRREAEHVLTGHSIYHVDEPILGSDVSSLIPLPDAESLIRTTIVCAGRLAPQKDFALALSAFALVDPALNLTLVLLGEGPLRPDLVEQARMLGITDRVKFAGYVPSISPRLAGARLFLMTSVFEGYPAVLIEALSHGIPVVTTPCSSAIHEIVADIEFGVVCSSRDPREIARSIEGVIARPMPDRDRLVAHTSRHEISIVSPRYLAVFDQLVSQSGTSSTDLP